MTLARSAATFVLRPFGERVVTVRGGAVAGRRMELQLAYEKRYWAGRYERFVQDQLLALDLAGRSAWDIGAHIGFFTLLLARRAERVVAVEANPETAVRLRRNVELNDAPVDVVEAAVSGESGVVEFDARSGQFAPESRIATGGNRHVRAVTLDELLEEHGAPAFVKLDVEGAELDALRAGAELLAARPSIFCELHGPSQREGVGGLLQDAGYRLAWGQWHVLAEPV